METRYDYGSPYRSGISCWNNCTKEGLLFANTSELFIDLKGKGGHAAYPHETNDMVVAACSLVGQLAIDCCRET